MKPDSIDVKPDGNDETGPVVQQGPDGQEGARADRPSLLKNVLLAATGQAPRRSPEESALEDAERRAEAFAKEAIRASQAALAAQETARRAAEEAAIEARKASQAALGAQAALKEAQTAKVALAARRAADRAAERAAGEAAREAAKEAAREAAARAAELAAQHAAAREVAERAAEAAAYEAAERAAREEAERAAQLAARLAADEAAKEAARQAAADAADRAAREAEAARTAEADRIARATRAAKAARAARAAKAEHMAKRAAEKAGVAEIKRPRRLNVKVAVGVPVTAAALLVGVLVAHAFQVHRTAGAMLTKAEDSSQRGEREEAIRYYSHYTHYRPQDHAAFSQLALLIADKAKRASTNVRAQWDAFAVLEKAAQQDHENMEVLRRLADVAMKVGRIDDAVVHLTRLQKKYPADPTLGVKLGECQIQLQKYSDAIATFERVTAQDKNNLKAYVALADLLRDKLDDPDRADAEVNQMVAENRKSAKALVERARYFHRGKQLTAATEDIKAALEIDPNNVEVLVTAAQFAMDNKAYEEAGEYLDKAQALHPEDETVDRARMVLNLSLGRTGEVIDKLRDQIQKQESSDAMDLLTYADLLLKKGDLKGVRETIKKMKAESFREEITEYFEARVEVAEGKWREASYRLERLRAKISGWPEFLVQVNLFLGACFEQLRLPDRQLSTYRSILDRDPTIDAARAGYASALFRVGKLDEAAAEYARLEKSMKDEFLKTPALRNSLFQLIIARTLRLPENYRDWSELEKFVDRLAKVDGVDEAQLTLMRAELLSKKNDNKKARELVDAQLAKHPKDEGLWSASIKLAAMLDGPQAGLDVAGRAAKECGDDVTLRLTKGELAVQLGQAKGKEVLEKLAERDDQFPEAERVRLWRGLGACWYRLRDRDMARQFWQKAVQSSLCDPQMFLVLFELAREAENEAQMAEAVKAVKDALGSRSGESLYCQSSELVWKAQRGKVDKKSLIDAKQMLREAGQMRPTWHEVPRLEAEIALIEEKPDEAITQFQKAADLGPLSPVYMGQLVQLLFARGRFEEARDVIAKLGRSEVSLTMKRIEAELSFRMGDFPQALAKAAEAVKESDRAIDFLWYGELLARTRKYDEALVQFRRAVELDPKIPQGWIGLVALLVETKQNDEAQRAVRQAQASLPEDRVALTLAQCHHVLGDLGRAEQYYLSALARAPEDLAVIRSVARFYMLTGRSEEAKKYLAQVLTLAGRDPEKNEAELMEARRWMARVLAAEGDWRQLQQALALLERNAKGSELPLEDVRLKAAMLAARPDQGSRQKAIEILEEIREKRKQELTPQEQLTLARLYEKTSRWTTARDLIRDLMQKHPKEPQYLFAYVQMLLDHDSPTSAIEYSLGKLEELAPGAAATKVLKARLLIKKGQAAEGVALLKSLIPRPLPDAQVGILPQVAATLEQLEQVDAARELLTEYAQKVPGGPLALAAFLGKHGKMDEALQQIEAAAGQVSPGAALPVVVAIFTEQRKHGPIAAEHFQRVEPLFKKAAEESPYAKPVQLQTAALRDLQENYAEQIRIYREFLARGDVLDREKAVVWNNLAFLLAAEGTDPDAALKMIDQAIELMGPVPELPDTRAVALLAAGKPKEAIAELQKAIADTPSGIMYFHLAQAHRADGDLRAAARALQVAHDNYQLTLDRVPKIERNDYQKLAAALKSL